MLITPKAHLEQQQPNPRKKASNTGLVDLAITGLGADALPELEELKTVTAESGDAHLVVHPGDVWLLGNHRLICGDCTKVDIVNKVLNGTKPHLMITDPPYNVNYDASWRDKALGGIEGGRATGIVLNDDKGDWREAWALFPGDVAYVWHAGNMAHIVAESLLATGFQIRSQIIWVKQQFVIGRGHYHLQHEPAWYCVRKGKTGHWEGDRTNATTWFIDKPKKSDTGHSTQKPIECMKRPIENNSKPGDAVYEPFCGSGTTIIAAELTGRRCFAIELNPLYVYVSINRWQMHTGKLARLEETNETFTEVLLRRRNETPQDLERVTDANTGRPPIVGDCILTAGRDGRDIAAPLLIEPEVPQLVGFEETETQLPITSTTVPNFNTKPAVVVKTPPARRFTVEPVKRKDPLADPFLLAHAETLRAAAGERMLFDAATWENDKQIAVGLDVEVYKNFFCACFKRFSDGKRITFEMSERCPLDREGLLRVLHNNTIITFNGNCFDLPIIFLAMDGKTNEELKAASDKIIQGSMKPWEVEKTLGVQIPRLNHVDLLEPNPSIRQGLKILAGRLHAKYLVDLPFHPDAILTPEQQNITILYCFNDLDCTQLVYDAMREPLDLRIALSREYKIDLRSKSDAQIGEAIVKKRVEQALNRRLGKGEAPAVFSYEPPAFLKFEGELQNILNQLRETKFTVNAAGKVQTPQWLDNLQVTIGTTTYSLGIGGLHTTEEHRALHSTNTHRLIDIDVASQYPNIILSLGLYPKAVGPTFLKVGREIVEERLAAKAAGDKVKADGGKIAANGGLFGKLGSVYSPLYAPHLLIATTLTGQLTMLMLAQQAENIGVQTVSGNTDGLIFLCPRNLEDQLNVLITEWEKITGFIIEKNYYKSIYNSSVNTYIALMENGKSKRKGAIANPWADNDYRGMMSKNPQMSVISDAVLAHVQHGTPIKDTINQCQDPRAFITVIKVTGGGQWRNTPLGRAVRFYWSKDGDPIMTMDGSRKVAKTEGSRPLMMLTDDLPKDIDYQRYYDEAERLARDLGIGSLI